MEKIITFFADEELFETLDDAKFFLKKPKSEIIREALNDYLNKNFPEDIRRKIKDLLGN